MIEYKYLHAIVSAKGDAEKVNDLLDVDIIQFFSEDYDALIVLQHMFNLQRGGQPITKEGLIRSVAHTETECENFIQLIKKLYSDFNLTLSKPKEALRKAHVDRLYSEAKEYLSSGRTEEEMKAFFADMHGRLNFYSQFSDVVEINQAAVEIQNSKHEIIKSYRISDPVLREFIPYLKAQEYNITGTPGSGKTTLAMMIENDLLKQGYNGLHLSFEDHRHITASKLMACNSGVSKYHIQSRAKNFIDKLSWTGKLYIADMPRNAEQTDALIRSYICREKIDFVVLDYAQLIRTRKRQSDMEALNELCDYKHAITLQYKIPFITLSQPTVDAIRKVGESKDKILTGGNEKGTGRLFEIARHAWYLSPLEKISIEGQTMITSRLFVGKGEGTEGDIWDLSFYGETGQPVSIEKQRQ